jgi:hypothetical protein
MDATSARWWAEPRSGWWRPATSVNSLDCERTAPSGTALPGSAKLLPASHGPEPTSTQQFLTMGIPVREAKQANAVDAIWLTAQSDSAKLVAAGLGVSYGSTEICAKEYAVAPADIELAASGLKVAAGTVAGVRWTFTTTTADGAPFLDVVNEQTVALGLATDWRQLREEPNWTVEVDGQPSIVCRLGLTEGIDQAGDSSTALNAAARSTSSRNWLPPHRDGFRCSLCRPHADALPRRRACALYLPS